MNHNKLLQFQVLKTIIFFTTLFSSGIIHAQKQLPTQAIQVTGGYSRHGSGDMNGIVFGTEYIHYNSKRFSLNYNFRGSINNGIDKIFIHDYSTGIHKDASIRFTTAGVQLGVNGQYSILRNKKHEFLISLGAFGRYQSASNGNDGYGLYFPAATGIPTVLVEYDNKTPQKTYALGGLFQLQYNFTIKNKIIIGLTPGFQTDTNGDAIPQVALIIGRRF